MSEFKSPASASRVTGQLQHVYFSPDCGSAETMWCADYFDHDYQEDYRDQPIHAVDVILLRHNMTNAPLASWKKTYYNDFGVQNEIGCGRLTMYASKRKAGPYVNENF
uniref:Capsid protein n=1 Tax=Lygus hesperus TaxID=30085 RepID=A0A0A9Y681_LYGHE